ncbi:MAG: hypothetical protein AB7P12_06495 [Alphaproteobacteria bacterium]
MPSLTLLPLRTCAPPAAYAADTDLANLATAELLLTATARLFVLPWRGGDGPHPDWRGGWIAAGIDDAGIAAFGNLFGIVATVYMRPLDIREHACPCLGSDEGCLLQLVSLIQHERVGDAQAILASWIPPAAVRMAMPRARDLAAAMARRSLTVPLRHAEAATPPRLTHMHADPGLVLVQ